MKIAHLELGRHDYGGAAQVRFLLSAPHTDQHEHVLVAADGSALHRWAQRVGQAHVAIAFAGEHDLPFIGRFTSWLRREEIDLVHVHSRRGADWMAPVAAGLARVPCLLTRRVDHVPGRLLRFFMRRSYRRVIGISDTITEVLRASSIPEDHLMTIRSAVDAETGAGTLDVRSSLAGCASDAPVIGVIAQLIERKGHRFLIDVLDGLRTKFPDLRVVFFGQGALEATLRQQVREAGHEDCVHFAGFRDDLLALLPSLTLVVHPALREGLGVSLLQAAVAGVPVVGFAAGGVREAVVNEHTGLLVKSGDSVALAAAIARVLADREFARQLGENARRHALQEFSVQTMAQRYDALYDVLQGEIS